MTLTILAKLLAKHKDVDDVVTAFIDHPAVTTRAAMALFDTELTRQHGMHELQIAGLNLDTWNSKSSIATHLNNALEDASMRRWLRRAEFEPEALTDLAIQALPAAAGKGFEVMLEKLLQAIPVTQRLGAAACVNERGRTALHRAVRSGNTLAFQLMFDLYPEAERLAAVKQVDGNGDSLLHLAAMTGNWDIFQAILRLYPETERLAAVQAINHDNKNVLYFAASPYAAFQVYMLYQNLPEPARALFVQTYNKLPDSLLYWAMPPHNSHILKEVLALYPEAERLAAVQAADNSRTMLLHEAARWDGVNRIMAILALLPEMQRLEALLAFNSLFRRLLSLEYSQNDMAAICKMLQLLPVKQRLTAVQTVYFLREKLILELASKNWLKEIAQVLSLLPVEDRFTALTMQDDFGNSCFHLAAKENDIAKMVTLLELLPENDRIKAIHLNPTIFERAISVNNSEAINDILALLPAVKRVKIEQHIDEIRRQVLLNAVASASCNVEAVSACLAALPEPVRTQYYIDNLLLHLAVQAKNLAALATLIQGCPPQDYHKLLRQKDASGNTVLRLALSQNAADMITHILAQVPASERLALLQDEGTHGLHLLSYENSLNRLAAVHAILNALTEAERLILMQAFPEHKGGPIFYAIASTNVPLLDALLDPLPATDAANLLGSLHGYPWFRLKEGKSKLLLDIFNKPLADRLERLADNYLNFTDAERLFLMKLALPGGRLLAKAIELGATQGALNLLLKNKEERQEALVKLFRRGDVKNLVVWFNELASGEHIFNLPYYELESQYRFLGQKSNTYYTTLGRLREEAFRTLLIEVDQLSTKAEQRQLLTWAMQQPLFNQHRSYRWEVCLYNTNTVKKIEQKLAEIAAQPEESSSSLQLNGSK